MVYVAFVTDVFSRRIVGWRLDTSMRTDLPLDALDMAIWGRDGGPLDGLVHHSDRGSQYTSIRYTERLIEAGATPSVGSVGDSYEVSRRRESHPPPLAEPCVKVALHTAPTVE